LLYNSNLEPWVFGDERLMRSGLQAAEQTGWRWKSGVVQDCDFGPVA